MRRTASLFTGGSMSSAVVIGIGTGEKSRSLAGCERLVNIGFPGESPEHLPGHTYMVTEVGHASEVVSKAFHDHYAVVSLPALQFHDSHPIDEKNVPLRTAFCREFYMLLSRKPFDMGDDVIDGLQGAAHLAANAKYLLPAPMPHELTKLDCPAIAVASGPSLSRSIDAIRALQDRCLIISCDSALDGLLKHGITPHIVTPFERVEEIKHESFSALSYSGIFAGNPAVHPSIAPLFSQHIYMPGTDLLYLWAESPSEKLLFFGQSTGVLAVSVAMNVTTGPIYLVGHDLAFDGEKSHWGFVGDGVSVDKGTIDKGGVFEVGGYSGPVTTQYWWDVFRREIENFASTHGNIINVNELDGIGARIKHTLPGSLPKPDELPVFTMPAFPAPNIERLERFRAKVRQLPTDARSVLSRLATSQRLGPADMDLRKLCRGTESHPAQLYSAQHSRAVQHGIAHQERVGSDRRHG
jgi:hypothetical protein